MNFWNFCASSQVVYDAITNLQLNFEDFCKIAKSSMWVEQMFFLDTQETKDLKTQF